MTKSYKVCKECDTTKPISEFYVHSRSDSKKGISWNPRCKPCVNKLQREKYKSNPEIKKNFHLKYLYGITLDEYNSILEAQNNCCFICKSTSPQGKGAYFHVDHNHKTNQIRGLLCHKCNFLLGYSKENIDTLQSAIDYINYWGGAS